MATGGSSTVTIATTASVAPGSYPITLIGTSPSASRSATFTLTVNAPPGCSAANGNDAPIPDLSTVEST